MVNISPFGTMFNEGQNTNAQTGTILVYTDGTPIQGLTGALGSTGIIGITGALGIQGLTGVSFQGVTGLQALTSGITGLQGVTGLKGFTGIFGFTGLINQGHTGIIGATGIQGVTGIQGNPGVAGDQGATGLTNAATGIQGATGVTGFTGLAVLGVTGLIGITGVEGVTGTQGVTGFGLLGATGLRGFTGLAGSTGLNDIQVSFLNRQLSGVTLISIVPANFLDVNNQQLDLIGTIQTATDSSVSTINVTFGGSNIFTDIVGGTGGLYGYIQGTIIRLGSSSQECIIAVTYEDGTCAALRTATTVNLAATQIFGINMSNENGGSVVLNMVVKKIGE